MDISFSFTLNGVAKEINSTLVNTCIIVILLSLLAIYIGNKVKKVDFKSKPKGIVFFAELYVETIQNLTTSTMGEKNIGFAPYIGTLAIFLAVANLFGLVGFKPPTSDYNVTLALALMTFFLIHFNNLRFNGPVNYVKGYFQPMAFLFPINLLGELAVPVSLSFRLLGNILSGTIIMTLMYSAFGGMMVFIAPLITPVFHGYFDVFSGLLQTFIFVMLTMVFISGAIGERE